MARAIWKGSISFGLVNIPIALYPATRREELKFRLLRKNDLSPVNYKRVAEKDGKEVPWDQIVKGYEYEKGKYVVLQDEDFQREMNMAKSLIGSMSSKWNPEKYHDDYREALREVIEEKVQAGGKEIEEKPKKAPKPTKVIDLVSVLQKSLEETGAKKKATTKSRRRHKQPAKKAA